MSLALFLRGSCTVSVPALFRTEAMDLCMRQGVQYTNFVWCEDGGVCFCCTVPAARRFVAACRAQGIDAEILAYRGLPRLFGRITKRAGFVVGAVLSVALIVLSCLFVWDVQVSGNVTLSEGEVIEELQKCGFGVGSYLPNLQVREIETRVLMASEGIGWISINMVGTVARVQVIEHIEGENEGDNTPTGKQAANLVATCDGQIEHLELYRGNAVVKVGQAVKAGELLVSGLYDTPTGGFRFTRAAGRVMARTERTVEVEIPLLYKEKVYEASFLQEIEVCFFNFSQKIFKNSRNSNVLCDIIKYNTHLGRLGNNRLPVSLSRTEVRPYHWEERTRTPEEALVLCYEELSGELSALSGEVQLLQKEIVTEIREDCVVLTCTVTCIENIARVQEFEIVQ
jgi:similar to stage IV sporulation protein